MKRRKAEAEHRAQVAISGRAQHALFETAHRLVDEQQHEALLDLLVAHAARRRTSEQLIHARVRDACFAGKQPLQADRQVARLRPEVEASMAALALGASLD